MKSLLIAAICLLASPSWAAKMFVHWTAPTQNTDGSVLTDLTGYRVEWGSCGPNGVFGTYQAGLNVPASVTRTAIYPTGLTTFCARVFAINSANVLSGSSNVAQGSVPARVNQPIH